MSFGISANIDNDFIFKSIDDSRVPNTPLLLADAAVATVAAVAAEAGELEPNIADVTAAVAAPVNDDGDR